MSIDVENPDNLPVIEETSLHEIVRRVIKWQESGSKIERIKTLSSKPSNSGFHNDILKYEDPDFNLIEFQDGFLPISDYLKVEMECGRIYKITSKKGFYWKVWDFATDLNENLDIGFAGVESNYLYCFNAVPIVTNKNKRYAIFDYHIEFSLITIGDIRNRDNFRVYFEESVNFYCTVFERSVNFNNCFFKNQFQISGGIKDHDQLGKDFAPTIFNDDLWFRGSIFLQCPRFYFCTFNGSVNFCFSKYLHDFNLDNCAFKQNVSFNSLTCTYLSLNFSQFEKNLSIKDIDFEISSKENKTQVQLQNSTFEKKLYFSLKDDTKENYGKVTLNLYHASIQDFVCDDRNLGEVHLYHTDNSGKIKENGDAEVAATKDNIEKAIAERRVFRKILQDLNWGDLADLEYAKIMELQTDLEKNKAKKWLVKFFFGWWLGWGVRILPDFHTDSWSNFWKFFIEDLKKGGIFLSSLLLAAVFTFILQLDRLILFLDSITGFILTRHFLFVFTQQTSDSDMNWFIDLINLIFSAGAETNLQTIVVIFGFIQMNLFLVILARKFMRM